jgi:ComF family protein
MTFLPPLVYHTAGEGTKEAPRKTRGFFPFNLGTIPRLMTLSLSATRLLRTLLHIVFPAACAGCQEPLWDDPVPFFCRPCWESLTPLPGPVCPRCGRPFASSIALRDSPRHQCGVCRTRPLAFTQAWSLFPYRTPLKEAITLFKYRGKLSLATPLAQVLIGALPDLPGLDCIIPVPLHPQRLREREYNQSSLLAARLSQHTHIPLLLTCLVRIHPTIPQTSLSRKKRLTNLRGAFSVAKPAHIRGRRILLVDDVFTTGTTLHECAKTLRRAGSGPVYGLTLARMV